MCGARTPIFLHMHDQAAAAQVLAAVEMEAMDLASHLLLGMPSLFAVMWTLPAADTAHCDTLVYPGALLAVTGVIFAKVSEHMSAGALWQA